MIYNINKFSNKKFKFDLTNQELLRLPNVNPNKILEKKVELITFDLNNVCMNGIIYTIEDFEKNFFKKDIRYVCLTRSQEILDEKFKSKNIFYLFPFLSYVEYDNLSLLEQYNILKERYEDCKRLFEFEEKYRTIQQQFSFKLKFKQSRKLRFKSLLDNNFFFAVKPGFADIFKLLENRPNRKIYQLDVNSMHPFAMTKENYSNPRDLSYYKTNNIEDILLDKITNGIFNCVLKIKSTLNEKDLNFIKYFPFNEIKEQTTIPINITKNDTINILLHANEIKFYSKYFDITLEDGVYSENSISHPLKKWVLDTYDKRLQSSGIQKDFYKFILVLSHSIALTFTSKTELLDIESLKIIFEQEYQMNYNNEELSNKYFSIKEIKNNSARLKSYDIKNSNNVYSLYSQVLANTRIHLLELYEKIHNSSKEFELCYCNIDSLHISIPSDKEELFKDTIKDLISPTELGKLKIESITNRGIWFEPGRYWLFNDNKLVNFKNTIFNDNNKDYKCIFKKVSYYKNKKYHLNYFSLFKSLQHKKYIEKVSDNEYIYNKNSNLVINMMNNLKIYKNIFKKFIK